jgi:hypothetical protein
MANHDIGHLERSLKTLSAELSRLSDEENFLELIKILHHPGWTTPAEFTFASGIVASMATQVGTLLALKESLIVGGRQVIEAAE